jgi:hypothetical protein
MAIPVAGTIAPNAWGQDIEPGGVELVVESVMVAARGWRIQGSALPASLRPSLSARSHRAGADRSRPSELVALPWIARARMPQVGSHAEHVEAVVVRPRSSCVPCACSTPRHTASLGDARSAPFMLGTRRPRRRGHPRDGQAIAQSRKLPVEHCRTARWGGDDVVDAVVTVHDGGFIAVRDVGQQPRSS